jgi:hypothetical protein
MTWAGKLPDGADFSRNLKISGYEKAVSAPPA